MKDGLLNFRKRTNLIQAILFLVMMLSALALFYLAERGNQAGVWFFLGLEVLANLGAALL
jgi:hypothetical protein